MMKQWITFLTAVTAGVSLISAAPFSSLIEDDVDVFLSLRSLAESRTQWEGHPFAEVIEDPELQDFFAPLLDAQSEGSDEESFTEVLENEFELTVEELFELFPGQVALAWFNMPELILEQAERPEMVLMAEFAGEPERLEELMQVQFERNAESQKEFNPEVEHTMIEESFMGETLHFDETFDGEETYIEDGYALVDGIFILALPETRLRSAVEAIKDRPEPALADSNAYLRSREMGGRGDLSVYLNLEAILPPLNQEMLSKAMESGAAMFGLSAQSLDAALSLESLQALYFDIDLIEKGLSSASGVIYREKTGLMSLMTYKDGSLPEARYVPKSVFSSSVTTFDFGAMLGQLEDVLASASPTLRPLIDMQMQNIRTNTGVDLRTSILGNFGGELVSLSILPEAVLGSEAVLEPEQVIVVELRDAEALSGALEALTDLAPGMRELIETQEFAGKTIHTIKATPDPNMPEQVGSDVSYVITRSHFILNIGRVGLLQEVLTRMGARGDGFWQLEETELLFEQIAQPGAVSRSYVDAERLIVPILQSIAQTSQFGGDATSLKMDSVPEDLELPFDIITEMNEESDGLFSRSLILAREAGK